MDTKAGSSYAYVALIGKLNRKPDRREYQTENRNDDDVDKSDDRNVQGPSL